jgi:hypothetical protein
VESFFEIGIEPSGSMKCWETIERQTTGNLSLLHVVTEKAFCVWCNSSNACVRPVSGLKLDIPEVISL